MATSIFKQADAMVQAVYARCLALTEAGYLDAAAFYMRKIIEIIASSFIERYDELGLGDQFEAFIAECGESRAYVTLDDKVDYLLARGNLPEQSKSTYDDVRRYGNAAVHQTYFREDPVQHKALLERLALEIAAYHAMAQES